MKRMTKMVLIVCADFIVAGAVLVLAAMIAIGLEALLMLALLKRYAEQREDD